MKNRETWAPLVRWFLEYASRFAYDDPADQANITLKRDHTFRVAAQAGVLAKSLKLDARDSLLARIMALFHDVGRFEQYHRYRTFHDAASVDHAALGLEILEERQVLSGMKKEDRDLIIFAIRGHNKMAIPQDAPERPAMFLRLLRDADKLDIWRVVTEYYRLKKRAPNGTIELDLPQADAITREVLADILAGRIVNSGTMQTTSDFMVMQMGWVFDLNYFKSFEILHNRGYLEAIAQALPARKEARDVYKHTRAYLDQRLNEAQSHRRWTS